MKKYILLLCFAIFCFFNKAVTQQIIIESSLTAPYTVPYLVKNVALGFGTTVNNITFTGDPLAIGYFRDTTNKLGLDSGIILTSGWVVDAIGPNTSTITGQSLGGPGDPDLTTLATFPTYDAAVLEFDFTALTDSFSFSFVFGSEEYLEWVNFGYNDVFAFWITGSFPGSGGIVTKNLAVVPGTTIPITINTINNVINTAYYINNETPPGQEVQYDGFTTPLIAASSVFPDSIYHMKIAIADASDDFLDSGVFLMKNCLNFAAPKMDTITTASCGDTTVTVHLDQPILCSSISPDGSDFRVSTPDGLPIPVIAATSTDCSGGNVMTNEVQLTLFQPLCDNGTYYLWVKTGFDFNTLYSECKVSLAEFDSVPIFVTDCFNEKVNLRNVTVINNDSTGILWNKPVAMPVSSFKSYDVYRSLDPNGPYSFVGSTFTINDTLFNDNTVMVDSSSYSYIIQYALGSCPLNTPSDSIASILLTEISQADTNKLNLSWTSYWGWMNPMYYIMESNALENNWTEIGATTANTYLYSKPLTSGSYKVKVETRLSGSPMLISESNWIIFDAYINEAIVPNIFTPNDDDRNEFFRILNIEQYPNSKLRIYNRWGKKVYENANYMNDWNGENFSDGVYFYILNVSDGSIKYGTVSILRG